MGMAKKTSVRYCLVCFCLAATVFVHAQNQSSPPAQSSEDSTPVFRSTPRLVLVDVVVTDHHGQFITGLKPADFTLLEDSKAQRISAFSVHVTPVAPKKALPPLKLPPHQYSNFTYVPQQQDRPVTIVLLDMMNTAGRDQQYARKQMIEFLKTLPEGRPVALFTLTSKLNMVQGFTGDSATLVKAATAVLAKSPLLMGDEAQQQQEEIGARALETLASPTGMGPNPLATSNATMPVAPIGQAIRNALDSEDSFQKLQRMQYTLEAFDVLAHSVAGYSGRKNLLWLSAEFPITFGPNMNPYNQAGLPINGPLTPDVQTNRQIHNLQYETPPLRETAALLTAAQIAVYPIDVGGVANPGTGIDISTPTSNLSTLDLQNETQLANVRQTDARWDAHEAMSDVARETGGEAFYGTNDLKDALARGMEQGSNYYTLAYTPTNSDWTGKYRKIEVKTDASGAKLTYRRGYYALASHPYSGDKALAAMALAMKFSVPEFTMLFLKVQVLPPDAEHKTVRIDYAIDAHDVTFTETADHQKKTSVDFVTTAWDKDLKLVAHKAETVDTTLRSDQYQQIMRTGLPNHQELDLKPGTYTLRMGVLDRGSQKIGTVDVPLTIP
jgi:VWFA-related protein